MDITWPHSLQDSQCKQRRVWSIPAPSRSSGSYMRSSLLLPPIIKLLYFHVLRTTLKENMFARIRSIPYIYLQFCVQLKLSINLNYRPSDFVHFNAGNMNGGLTCIQRQSGLQNRKLDSIFDS